MEEEEAEEVEDEKGMEEEEEEEVEDEKVYDKEDEEEEEEAWQSAVDSKVNTLAGQTVKKAPHTPALPVLLVLFLL